MSKAKSARLKPSVYVKAAKAVDTYFFSCHAVTAAVCESPQWNGENPYTCAYQDAFARTEKL